MSKVNSRYFSGYSDYFWQWEEDGQVISIPNGPTIIYREPLWKIIESLHSEGTPLFGSLLLAIIATNPECDTALNVAKKIFEKESDSIPTNDVNNAFKFLGMLSKLPEQYKTAALRITLLQTIFHQCHYKISILQAKYLAQFLEAKFIAKHPIVKENTKNRNAHKELRTLSLLLNKYPDPQHILNEMAGIPNQFPSTDITPPFTPTLQKPIPEKTLVDELISNQQTFHIGSLIKYLWSGLNITLHNLVPSAQPLGGISDLTNKGSIDRILLSEFANDDLVLMSRLANNEALYIQREIPPEHNENERILLIDTSLKMWGTPKVLSYAIMLAIAKHPKTDISCRAFAVGTKHEVIAFETIDEVIQSIQLVSGSTNAVAGIHSYFEEFPDHKNREIILITEEGCVHTPEMINLLSAHQSSLSYLIFVDYEGNITVQKRQKSGNKILQKISLPLDELWKKTMLEGKINTRAIPSEIPILISNPSQPQSTLRAADDKLYQITTTGYILHYHTPKHHKEYYANVSEALAHHTVIYWEVLFPEIRIQGTRFEIGKNQINEPILLHTKGSESILTLTNLHTGRQISSHIPGISSDHGIQLLFIEEHFYISLSHNQYWQLSVDGTLRSQSKMDATLFVNRAKSEAKTNNHIVHLGSRSIIKKANLVGITSQNQIVIGAFVLTFKDGHFEFKNNPKASIVIKAYRSEKSIFIFPDGSSVHISAFGMMMLLSSDNSIPPIYIPTPTDTLLGMQADTTFAGNPSFHNYNRLSDTVIKVKAFDEKYIRPFIERIRTFPQ
jgi:hypothetical protein